MLFGIFKNISRYALIIIISSFYCSNSELIASLYALHILQLGVVHGVF